MKNLTELQKRRLTRYINITNYIKEYFPLEEKETNPGIYVGESPFLDRPNKNFITNKKTNSFYCYAIRKGGTIIDFEELYHNLTEEQAARKIKFLLLNNKYYFNRIMENSKKRNEELYDEVNDYISETTGWLDICFNTPERFINLINILSIDFDEPLFNLSKIEYEEPKIFYFIDEEYVLRLFPDIDLTKQKAIKILTIDDFATPCFKNVYDILKFPGVNKDNIDDIIVTYCNLTNKYYYPLIPIHFFIDTLTKILNEKYKCNIFSVREDISIEINFDKISDKDYLYYKNDNEEDVLINILDIYTRIVCGFQADSVEYYLFMFMVLSSLNVNCLNIGHQAFKRFQQYSLEKKLYYFYSSFKSFQNFNSIIQSDLNNFMKIGGE